MELDFDHMSSLRFHFPFGHPGLVLDLTIFQSQGKLDIGGWD